MSGSSGGGAPTYTIYTGGGGQLPNPECISTLTSATKGETLTPNPNECNSTLTSVTRGKYFIIISLLSERPVSGESLDSIPPKNIIENHSRLKFFSRDLRKHPYPDTYIYKCSLVVWNLDKTLLVMGFQHHGFSTSILLG